MEAHENTQSTEQLPGTSRRAGRAQFLRYLLKIGIANDMETGPQLRRMLDVSDVDFDTRRSAILSAVQRAIRGDEVVERTHCPRCNETLRAPSIDVQLANFVRWQLSQPEVFHWSDNEMEALRAALQPGDILQPAYAKSVYIRRPDGSFVLYERSK